MQLHQIYIGDLVSKSSRNFRRLRLHGDFTVEWYDMAQKISDLRVVATSSAVSLADVTLNALIGWVTGSTVMFSQALQGLSDLTTGGLLLNGVRNSKKIADDRYQFGYGRELFFWVLMAGLLMFLGTGAVSVYLGYQQFVQPHQLDNAYLAIGFLLFGTVTNGYAFSLSVKRLRQTRPQANWWWQLRHSSIVETKATLLVDFLGTVAAIMGLIALLAYALTGNAKFDGLGSIAIGLAMMVASTYLIRDVRSLIVGRSVDGQTSRAIISATKSVQGVEDVLDLRTMYLGSGRLLVIIEVHLEDNFTTDQIEAVTDIIKGSIQAKVPEARHIQVEIETPEGESLS